MRYVPMDNVVIDGERRFAFFDTVRDKFASVSGEQTWDSIAALDRCFDEIVHGHDVTIADLPKLEEARERLIGLARGNGALEESAGGGG